MLVCPRCSSLLKPFDVPTESGGNINIDICNLCKGLWLDHWEINRLPLWQATQLSQVDINFVGDWMGSGRCPRCHLVLQVQKAESIPQDIIILSCPRCHGNFIDQKEIMRLKQNQQQRLIYFKTSKTMIPSLYAILIPLFVIAMISLTSLMTVRYLQQSHEDRIRAQYLIEKPVILQPDNQSIIIIFSTQKEVTSLISYYGPGITKTQTLVSQIPKKVHQVLLINLKTGNKYFFQITITDEKGQVTTFDEESFVVNE